MNPFKFDLSLRVFSRTLNAAQISSALRMSPRWSQTKGEPRRTPRDKPLPGTYEETYCSFRLEVGEQEGLADAIDRHLSALGDERSAMLQRIRVEGGRAEFFVGWYSNGNTGEVFCHGLVKKLADSKLDLALDVYGADAAVQVDQR